MSVPYIYRERGEVGEGKIGMERQQELGGERRRVVVVGGGVAGSLVAKSLQFHGDVTLIDS